MGWAVWPFDDAAQPGTPAPIALSYGGEWLGFSHIMLIVPEEALGMVLLLNSQDPVVASAYSNIAFDVALLALGREPQHYPPEESWVDQHLRPLSIGLIIFLLIGAAVALRQQRRNEFNRRDAWLFVGLAIVDLALTTYSLFIRLPANNLTVRQVIRFQPDLGILLVVILLLTIGWGSVRSLWVIRRWQTGSRR